MTEQAPVTYAALASEIIKKHVEREGKIAAMKQVANALCHEVINQLTIPQGNCRIGAAGPNDEFLSYDWGIGEDGSMTFAIQVDYVSGEDLIAQHHVSFVTRANGGMVNLKCLQTGGEASVPYAPQIQDMHLRIAAQQAIIALKVAADKYRG